MRFMLVSGIDLDVTKRKLQKPREVYSFMVETLTSSKES
jgi:hypothetical protein